MEPAHLPEGSRSPRWCPRWEESFSTLAELKEVVHSEEPLIFWARTSLDRIKMTVILVQSLLHTRNNTSTLKFNEFTGLLAYGTLHSHNC